MFSRLREHFGTAGLVVAIVALIAALAGGAVAATGGNGNGTKATASAKGKPGPRGKTGKTGPQGPGGPVGPQGAKGDPGAPGANGTNGAGATTESFGGEAHGCKEGGVVVKSASPETIVCNGKKGTQGAAGPQGPPGPTCNEEGECLLPPGATETGAWAASSAPTFAFITSISYPLRLSAEPQAHFVTSEEVENLTAPSECPGSASEPKAAPGNVCVYAAFQQNSVLAAFIVGIDPTSGLVMSFEVLDEAKFAKGWGAWAVTAPSTP